MGWLKLTQWGRWSREVCPVANSRLWPRLAGSIHRRALRDRFTNPPLPTSTPSLPFSLSPFPLLPPKARATFAYASTTCTTLLPSFLPSFLEKSYRPGLLHQSIPCIAISSELLPSSNSNNFSRCQIFQPTTRLRVRYVSRWRRRGGDSMMIGSPMMTC